MYHFLVMCSTASPLAVPAHSLTCLSLSQPSRTLHHGKQNLRAGETQQGNSQRDCTFLATIANVSSFDRQIALSKRRPKLRAPASAKR